jgi:curved DNA-binding protein CbpA
LTGPVDVPHGAGVRGRPPGDPYAVLGLAPGATAADVQRAYRRRARLLHPDIAGEGATTRMAELNVARDAVLSELRPPNGSH